MLRSMNPMVAYQKGLTTWAKWVDLNLDPHKTRVIFRSVSPRHNRYHTTPSNSIYHTQNSGKQKVIIVWGFLHMQAEWLEMLQPEATSRVLQPPTSCSRANGSAKRGAERDEISSIPARHHNDVGSPKRWASICVYQSDGPRTEAAPKRLYIRL